MSASRFDRLKAENAKLREALSELIPWAGESAYGPDWATPEVKQRNKEVCERAIQKACACFPEDYNGFRELAESN